MTPERRARAMPREAIQRVLDARRRDSLAMRREYVIIEVPVLRSDERQDSRAPKGDVSALVLEALTPMPPRHRSASDGESPTPRHAETWAERLGSAAAPEGRCAVGPVTQAMRRQGIRLDPLPHHQQLTAGWGREGGSLGGGAQPHNFWVIHVTGFTPRIPNFA